MSEIEEQVEPSCESHDPNEDYGWFGLHDGRTNCRLVETGQDNIQYAPNTEHNTLYTILYMAKSLWTPYYHIPCACGHGLPWLL